MSTPRCDWAVIATALEIKDHLLFQLAYAAVTKDMDIKDTLEAAKRAEKGVEGGELDKKEMMQTVVTPKVREGRREDGVKLKKQGSNES